MIPHSIKNTDAPDERLMIHRARKQMRFEPLSKSENSVYHLMDTLNKIPAVATYAKIISALSRDTILQAMWISGTSIQFIQTIL